MSDTALKWRKFTPIDREHPIYELVEGDVILFDLARRDDGELEIAFHEGIRGRVLDLAVLETLIAQGKILIAEDDADE